MRLALGVFISGPPKGPKLYDCEWLLKSENRDGDSKAGDGERHMAAVACGGNWKKPAVFEGGDDSEGAVCTGDCAGRATGVRKELKIVARGDCGLLRLMYSCSCCRYGEAANGDMAALKELGAFQYSLQDGLGQLRRVLVEVARRRQIQRLRSDGPFQASCNCWVPVAANLGGNCRDEPLATFSCGKLTRLWRRRCRDGATLMGAPTSRGPSVFAARTWCCPRCNRCSRRSCCCPHCRGNTN